LEVMLILGVGCLRGVRNFLVWPEFGVLGVTVAGSYSHL